MSVATSVGSEGNLLDETPEQSRLAFDLLGTPVEFRAAERERQQSRRRRQAAAGSGPPMSRAGLSAEVTGAIEEIIENLGQAERMSRAGLRRRLRHLFAGTVEIAVAQVGT